MTKKQILALIISACVFSCAINQSHRSERAVKLNFSKCIVSSEAFKYLIIQMPKGYSKKFIENEGVCEYRFAFKDGAIAYVSSDVWYGSSLNFENRHSIGHESYNKKALLDTIVLKDIQANNKYWSEQIIGNIMVGYVNASEDKRALFEKAFSSIKKFD
ncbi:MAG TPA: hypothetical protein PKC76_19360 [Saprospiraceae bacterium]|nr:hypothetical protein [Saprospiraceae bacterium]